MTTFEEISNKPAVQGSYALSTEKPKYFDPEKHLIVRGGTRFINMAGLFAKLADDGKHLLAVETQMLRWPTDKDEEGEEYGEARCKATIRVKFPDGETGKYEGHGEANDGNVTGPQVKNALPRMAESRAIVRAMRFATRSEETALGEVEV